MQEEAPHPPSELSSEPPKGWYKWYWIILAVVGFLSLWNKNFKVDVLEMTVKLIKVVMMMGPVLLFMMSPLSDRLPKIIEMAIVILLLIFGIVFVEAWGEKKVRKWLNKPEWYEKYEKQR